MTSIRLRIGTRCSPLAMAQTTQVVGLLNAAYPDLQLDVITYGSTGDINQDIDITQLPGNAFTDHLDAALIRGEIDLAVHSYKDLPHVAARGLTTAAVPLREDPRECIVARDGLTIDSLPFGAVVGTSSDRRREVLSAMRPDLTVRPIRGSVDSRIEQLRAGQYDAIVLAVAGLQRLGLAHHITQVLDSESFPYAAGQGALAVQCRSDDSQTIQLVRAIDNPVIHSVVLAERLREQPLSGVRVLVTRPAGMQDSLTTAIESLGGSVVSLPLVHVETLPSPLGEAPAAAAIADSSIVLFTSANGVEQAWRQACPSARHALRSHSCIVVLGPGTARAARACGMHVARVAEHHISEGVIAILGDLSGKSVLWMRSAQARPLIAESVVRAGGTIAEWSIYRTRPSPLPEAFHESILSADVITLTSPSIAAALVAAAGVDLEQPIVCIGPVTADAARRLKLNVAATATTHTAAGLVDALVDVVHPGRGRKDHAPV